MAEYEGPVCVLCGVKACTAEPDAKTPPGFCPMPAEPELLADVERAYLADPDLRRMALESARTEAAGYGRATRVEEKVRPGQYEAMCSPVGQAALLAKAGTQFNVVIGLCVGHDSLFFMHTEAPATVLVAKDRVLGHNPAAALYTSHSYYRRLAERPAGKGAGRAGDPVGRESR